jgi:hypothetical protein
VIDIGSKNRTNPRLKSLTTRFKKRQHVMLDAHSDHFFFRLLRRNSDVLPINSHSASGIKKAPNALTRSVLGIIE